MIHVKINLPCYTYCTNIMTLISCDRARQHSQHPRRSKMWGHLLERPTTPSPPVRPWSCSSENPPRNLAIKSEKRDAAHEPECSHVKHFCEISYLKSLVLFPLFPYHFTVDCGMWNGVECKVWNVKKVKCWVGNVVCRVWSGDCGVYSVKCKV